MLGHARARHLVLAARWFLADRNTIDRWQVCCQKRRPWRKACLCLLYIYNLSGVLLLKIVQVTCGCCWYFLPVNTLGLCFQCLCTVHNPIKESHETKSQILYRQSARWELTTTALPAQVACSLTPWFSAHSLIILEWFPISPSPPSEPRWCFFYFHTYLGKISHFDLYIYIYIYQMAYNHQASESSSTSSTPAW